MEQNNLSISYKEGFVVVKFHKFISADRFFELEKLLETKLSVVFYNKVNDFDNLYWHFTFKGAKLVLHHNIFDEIEIYPESCKKASSEENNAAIEFVDFLKSQELILPFSQLD